MHTNHSLPEAETLSARFSFRIPEGSPEGLDVDFVALLLGRGGRVRSDEDFIFFNQPRSTCGSVTLSDSDFGAGDGECRAFEVRLASVPREVQRIVIGATVHDRVEGRTPLNKLADTHFVLVSPDGTRVVAQPLSFAEQPQAVTAVVATLEQTDAGWTCQLDRDAGERDLGAFARRYGVNI